MEINEGVAKVSASYSLKLPTDVPYASEDVYMNLTLEIPVEGDLQAVKDRLLDVEAELATEVKLAVFAQLDVEPKELPSGVIAPDLSKFNKGGNNKGKSSSTKRQGNRSNSGRSGKSNGGRNTSRRGTGGRRGSNGSSGADKSNLPRVDLAGYLNPFEADEWVESTFIDVRDLKRDGTYSARAADFSEDGGKIQLWITNKDGTPNDDVLEALDEAGIDYDIEEFV